MGTDQRPPNPRCRKRSRGSGSAGLRYPNPEGRISGRRPLGRRAHAGQTAALCDRNRERRRQRPPDRYWSVEVADSYTNNLFYIGTRATGGKGGNHAFVGPNWKGTLPPGVVEHRVPTDSVMFAIRIGVLPGDAADLAKVNALQEQFTLTSLDNWADPAKHGQAAVPDLGPRPHHEGELAFFQTLADLLTENPPTTRQRGRGRVAQPWRNHRRAGRWMSTH